MAVPIDLRTNQTLTVGLPVPLFRTHIPSANAGFDSPWYAVAKDGQRFLMNEVVDDESASPITIFQNWAAGLKK